MTLNTVSILDGNNFVVSDRRGDMEVTPNENHGLFLNDTRFLSRWVLTIDGRRSTVLSVDELDYYRVQFFEALATGTVYVDSRLSVVRERTIQQGFCERIAIVNHDKWPIEFELRIDADSDFADLFEVKDKLEKKGKLTRRVEGGSLILSYARGAFRRETKISCDIPGEVDNSGYRFRIHLAPRAIWTVHFEVHAVRRLERTQSPPSLVGKDGIWRVPESTVSQDLASSTKEWIAHAPTLSCAWEPLTQTYRRSLIDLAALRFRSPLTSGAVPAAGLPWFMALFGRDSLITSFQAVPFFPELAAATLQTLALLQGRIEDPFRDEEPGKILHELRLGEMTAFEERPHSPYYGSADSTPLFLVLLEEYERWHRDHPLVHALHDEAHAAMDWIDHHGDRDGDGFIEYERRLESGLENQCWKDSWDSIAFADGRLASSPRATCELQGYVYDAKRRTARLARTVWNEPAWAEQLEIEAEVLKRRFNEEFWLPERGFFALGLDGEKRKIDSLTSNIGHLLWSEIADPDKAAECVRHLMGDALFSGWGVRTMAVGEGSYNPIGYHVGTVWPHDNSIIAWGLRRYGYREESATISQAMLEAAEHFGHRLPEAFAGYPRSATRHPVEYPTACSPQAWASAAPLLFLRALLGLDSDGEHMLVEPALPQSMPRLELLDIPGRWGRMDAFGRSRPLQPLRSGASALV
jgi:glycogen debranching enzyme